LAAALAHVVSDEVGARSLAPFAFDDVDEVIALCRDLGCANISATRITVDRVIGDPDMAIPKEILANPVGAAVKAAGDAAMREIVKATNGALSAFRYDSGLVIPQQGHLVQATQEPPK